MKFLEKYCINSTVRLHDKEQSKYWEDPTIALKEFSPESNYIDTKLYDFIVPASRRAGSSGLGSFEGDFSTIRESDSDSDFDRFGGVKKVPDIQDLIEKWEAPSSNLTEEVQRDTSLIESRQYGIGSSLSQPLNASNLG